MKRTTPKEVKKWIKLNHTYSIPEISKIVKRPPSTLYKGLKKINYKRNSFNRKRRFTDEKIIQIYKEYIGNNNTGINYLSRKYKTTWSTLHEGFHSLLLPTKDIQTVCHNYNINHNFFNKIDSEIKAYLLGFFAADGHIQRKKDSYVFAVFIHYKDSEIIRLFNKYIANGQAKLYKRENTRGFQISSNQIGEDLKKLGYDNRKTYTCNGIPDIPQKLMCHFIRGYFDGDGSIGYYNRKMLGRHRHTDRRFTICAKNKSILVDMLRQFPPLTGGRVYLNERNDSHHLTISDIINLKIIYKYMYSYSKYYLKRKKKIFDKVICDGYLGADAKIPLHERKKGWKRSHIPVLHDRNSTL